MINHMKHLFNDPRFHRFLWFSACSQDTKILDPKRIIEVSKKANATVIHYPATGSSSPDTVRAFYNSKVIEKAPWIGNRDFFGEVVNLGHKNNMKVIAYFNGHWFPDSFINEHPSWSLIMADGKKFSLGFSYGGGAPCVNVPEFQKYSTDVLTELTVNYPIDGIFLDGPAVFQGTCYCPVCKEMFKKQTGAEMPVASDWNSEIWYAFLKFRYDSMRNYLALMHEVVHKIRRIPIYKNSVVLNTTWFNCLGAEELRDYSENIGAEHFVFYGEPITVPIWGAGAAAKYERAIARDDKTATIYLCYGHKTWDYYTLPTADMRLLIAETAANGAYPFVTIDDYQMVNDTAKMKPINDMFGFIHKNEKYFLTESANNVAILWSNHTEDYYTKATLGGAAGTHHYEIQATQANKEYQSCFRGFYEMLTQAHIPFDVIGNVNIESGDLKKYKTLIMPNAAAMNANQIKIVDAFVANGGTVITSFEASLYDEFGKRMHEYQLKCLNAVIEPFAKEDNVFQTVRDYQKIIKKHKVTSSNTVGNYLPIPHYNFKVKLKKNTDYQVLTQLMNPIPHRYHSFVGTSDLPGLVVGEYGKGKVVYFSGLVGVLFYKYRIRDIREFVANAVKWSQPLQLKTNAPKSVEFNLRKLDDGTIVLHILNWTTRISRPVEDIVQVYDMEIGVKFSGKKSDVRVLAAGKKIKSVVKAGYVTFKLSTVGDYEVVVIK